MRVALGGLGRKETVGYPGSDDFTGVGKRQARWLGAEIPGDGALEGVHSPQNLNRLVYLPSGGTPSVMVERPEPRAGHSELGIWAWIYHLCLWLYLCGPVCVRASKQNLQIPTHLYLPGTLPGLVMKT